MATASDEQLNMKKVGGMHGDELDWSRYDEFGYEIDDLEEVSTDPDMMKEYAEAYWRSNAAQTWPPGEVSEEDKQLTQNASDLLHRSETAEAMALLLWDTCPDEDDTYAWLLSEFRYTLATRYSRTAYARVIERVATRPWSPDSIAQNMWEEFWAATDEYSEERSGKKKKPTKRKLKRTSRRATHTKRR